MPTPNGPRPARGRYEVRPHPSIGGLLSIVHIQAGTAPGVVLNVGDSALPLIAQAVNEYLARHPGLAVPEPAEEAVPAPRLRTGGLRAGALSIANDTDQEDS